MAHYLSLHKPRSSLRLHAVNFEHRGQSHFPLSRYRPWPARHQMKAAATPPLSSPSYCSGHTTSTSHGGTCFKPALTVPRFGSSHRPTGPSSRNQATRISSHSSKNKMISTAVPSPLSSGHGGPLRRVSAPLRASSGSIPHSSPPFPTSSSSSSHHSPPTRNVTAAFTGKELGPSEGPGPGSGGYGRSGAVGASPDRSDPRVLLSDDELALVSFHIPVADPTTDPRDVVAVPHIRRLLVPRDRWVVLVYLLGWCNCTSPVRWCRGTGAWNEAEWRVTVGVRAAHKSGVH